jgi:hypothetical protein
MAFGLRQAGAASFGALFGSGAGAIVGSIAGAAGRIALVVSFATDAADNAPMASDAELGVARADVEGSDARIGGGAINRPNRKPQAATARRAPTLTIDMATMVFPATAVPLMATPFK